MADGQEYRFQICQQKYTLNAFTKTNIDFVGLRKYAYIFSIAIFVISLLSIFIRGLNYGVDFSGGRTYVVRFDQDVQTAALRDALTTAFVNETGQTVAPEVKTFGPNNQVKITTKFMIDNDAPEVDSIIQAKLFNGLKPFYRDPIKFNEFSTTTEAGRQAFGSAQFE